jgi:hypothetical protein
MAKLDIDKIERTFGLLTKINCSNRVNASELAKELGSKKTELMAFILDNKDLFVTRESKNGLIIEGVYNTVDKNPYTIEYLRKKIAENDMVLYVRRWNFYGQYGEYYIKADYDYENKAAYDKRYDLWRNTQEKIKRFKVTGHYHEGYGPTGTFDGQPLTYCLYGSEMLDLIAEGWKLIGELPEKIKNMQEEKEE